MSAHIRELTLHEGKILQNTLRKSKNRSSVRRAQVFLLSAQGMKAKEIAKIVYLNEVYVRELIRRYNNEGLSLLKEKPHTGTPH